MNLARKMRLGPWRWLSEHEEDSVICCQAERLAEARNSYLEAVALNTVFFCVASDITQKAGGSDKVRPHLINTSFWNAEFRALPPDCLDYSSAASHSIFECNIIVMMNARR